MSNNAPDYKDNLVFPPQEVKSQDDIKQEGRQSEVLIKALEKCEKLEKENQQLKELLLQTRNRQSLIIEYLADCKFDNVWDLLYQTENEIDNAIGDK